MTMIASVDEWSRTGVTGAGVRLRPAALAGAVGDPGVVCRIETALNLRLSSRWRMAPGHIGLHAIHAFTAGRAAGRIGGRAVALGPGSLFWIAPGVDRAIDPLPGSPPTTYHLRFELLRGGVPISLRGGHLLLEDAWACRADFDRLIDLQVAARGRRQLQLRAALMQLLARIVALAEEPTPVGPALAPDQREVCWRYLRRHAVTGASPAGLAHALGLSHDHFTRCFRRSFGCPPRTWLLRERIRLVAERLREDPAPIAEIAAASGFDEPSRFSRQFRQIMGCTPSAWRRRG